MNTPVTWFEIIGKDPLKLQKFYQEVFNWPMTPPMPDMGNYSMLTEHGSGISGGIGGGPEDKARVTVYVEVDDPEAYMAKAVENGATMVMPVSTITEGVTIGLFTDPEGNVTGLMKSNPA